MWDAPLASIRGGDLVKVMAWDDNELAFPHRLLALARQVGRHLG